MTDDIKPRMVDGEAMCSGRDCPSLHGHADHCRHIGPWCPTYSPPCWPHYRARVAALEAALAAAEAERDRLKAAEESLRFQTGESELVLVELLLSAAGDRARLNGARARVAALESALAAAEAERDRLKATVERVEELGDCDLVAGTTIHAAIADEPPTEGE